MSDALVLQDIHRTFQQGDVRLEVLRGAELTLRPGELVALVGPSGAGKSTLLQVAGLLERPDSGRIVLGGEDCQALDDTGRTLLRRQALGFVYQFHHLLPEFTALENVMMPMLIAGTPKKAARDTARDLLDRVGLAQRAEHRPSRLSGGEQQRVAIVRALANGPRVLLADEPTGNLDPHTADGVLARFLDLARQTGLAALVATHNPELARALDRTVTLSDGKLTAA